MRRNHAHRHLIHPTELRAPLPGRAGHAAQQRVPLHLFKPQAHLLLHALHHHIEHGGNLANVLAPVIPAHQRHDAAALARLVRLAKERRPRLVDRMQRDRLHHSLRQMRVCLRQLSAQHPLPRPVDLAAEPADHLVQLEGRLALRTGCALALPLRAFDSPQARLLCHGPLLCLFVLLEEAHQQLVPGRDKEARHTRIALTAAAAHELPVAAAGVLVAKAEDIQPAGRARLVAEADIRAASGQRCRHGYAPRLPRLRDDLRLALAAARGEHLAVDAHPAQRPGEDVVVLHGPRDDQAGLPAPLRLPHLGNDL